MQPALMSCVKKITERSTPSTNQGNKGFSQTVAACEFFKSYSILSLQKVGEEFTDVLIPL